MEKHSAVLADAVTVIMKGLTHLPKTVEVQELRGRAIACIREANDLRAAEQADILMKRVLALHMEARKLAP
jgi:hypothetical protein